MSSASPPPPESRPLLRRSEQLAAAALTAAALVILLIHFLRQAQQHQGTIDIDQAEPLTAEFTVDLNSAPWMEIAELPNIGEKVAKEIVAERDKNGRYASYKDVERRVKGIGAKLMERIKPYLTPLNTD